MQHKYKVTADLTPFFDRWGSEHFRIIYQGDWLILAYVAAFIHCYIHPDGSAIIKSYPQQPVDKV